MEDLFVNTKWNWFFIEIFKYLKRDKVTLANFAVLNVDILNTIRDDSMLKQMIIGYFESK